MTKFKVTKTGDNDYEYRGIEFTRVDCLSGYYGHYRTCGRVGDYNISSFTRKELLYRIDQALDAKQGE